MKIIVELIFKSCMANFKLERGLFTGKKFIKIIITIQNEQESLSLSQ